MVTDLRALLEIYGGLWSILAEAGTIFVTEKKEGLRTQLCPIQIVCFTNFLTLIMYVWSDSVYDII